MQPMRALALLALFAPAASLVIPAPLRAVGSSRAFVRMQESPPPPPTGRLGATVDQDGKSNVWAVEPAMKVDNTNQDKGIVAFAPVLATLSCLSSYLSLWPRVAAPAADVSGCRPGVGAAHQAAPDEVSVRSSEFSCMILLEDVWEMTESNRARPVEFRVDAFALAQPPPTGDALLASIAV
eukprot:scaffold315706_cov27-Tisochrysis_lutea.AAC.1